MPGDGEGAVPAAAAAADGPPVGVVGDRPAPGDLRDDLGQQEGGQPVVEGVVLDVAVLRARARKDAGVDEQADGVEDVAAVVQVVEDDRAPDLAFGVEVPLPVQEDDQRRGLR
ncbi:hypothetical protein OWR29_35430 [Actinoplanes sp. Pm04-4]|uniref:Uncharacterized protein n=1 Tax=Paractinoplanes pyxinae TaxID=2997416 RepID=A0ABT4B9X9_9ACTN|nr:hypothetical protein [Actinoplanes pyxinae]MCY1143318.1 hypothetical protein [Actinoplanes pyxinae]